MSKNLICSALSLLVLTGAGCDTAKIVPIPTPALSCGANFGSCQSGYTCIEKCGPPVVREGDAPPGYYCETNENAKKPRLCPICLAENTMIQTPSGEINVTALKQGDSVWSQGENGNRVAVPILEVSKTPVPKTHQVVHLVLNDGREVWVSPQHPLITGNMIMTLNASDSYDGSVVVNAKLEAYTSSFTYDLLPDSPSGVYFANGIPLKSTLAR